MEPRIINGRGAQINPVNPFLNREITTSHPEGIDEYDNNHPFTQVFYEQPKTIISRFESPDVPYGASINPYQGCEHGCVYCYARNSHEYWGFSSGLDFESKIIVKKNAASLLEKQFLGKSWQSHPIMLSGNTDCYQPLERKLKITRQLLQVFLKYRNPVSIITKNSLILRDIDLLTELAGLKLVHVMVSINSLDESLRRNLEPRTATFKKRLSVVTELSRAGIPVGVMIAPIIPGLNMHDIPAVVEAAAKAGAQKIGHTVLRLNGKVAEIFRNWMEAVYPEKVEKVWSHVQSLHGGQVNDSRFLKRMLGEGKMAEMVLQMLKISITRFMPGRDFPAFDLNQFRTGGMYSLWE
jgi:DNA repair photolyase